jgi:hypothetical protein
METPRGDTAMKAKRLILHALPAAALLSFCLSTSACVASVGGYDDGTEYEVGFEPPALRDEVIVERPSGGHVWVGGHYDYEKSKRDYTWHGGSWQKPPHAHQQWVAPHYEKRGNKSYYTAGHWH